MREWEQKVEYKGEYWMRAPLPTTRMVVHAVCRRTVAHNEMLCFLRRCKKAIQLGRYKPAIFGNSRIAPTVLKYIGKDMSRRALTSLLPALRAQRRPASVPITLRAFSSSPHSRSSGHEAESFESFTERYTTFFQSVEDLFELQRGLNNCFAYDLVPAPGVIEAALRAARRVDDYSTAVRIFEGIKEKVENKSQYEAYLKELKGVKEELGTYPDLISWQHHPLIVSSGIDTKEELYGQ